MRRAALLLVLLATALTPCAAGRGFDYAHLVGLAVVERLGTPYLVIPEDGLQPGDEVAVVDLSRPYKVVAVRIGKPFDRPCPATKDVMRGARCYSLVVPEGSRLHWGPHIAVVAPAARFVADKGGVAAALDEGVPPTTFRVCAAREGLHFSLWRGAPVKGQRLWHCYYGLRFDLEPDCQPGEAPEGR
jgi:hypothetical protein